MEREDATGTGRHVDDDVAGDKSERPAGPGQPDDGFAEGIAREDDGADREPDYARGIDAPRDDDDAAEGRYSRGAEAPDTEERSSEGNFARGIEQSDT